MSAPMGDDPDDGAQDRAARGGRSGGEPGDGEAGDGGPRSAVRREWMVAVGGRVRRLRVRAGLTPRDAAERTWAAMDRAGDTTGAATESAAPAPVEPVVGRLDAGRWRAIESGAVGALDATTLDEVFAMASVLGVTAQELMDTDSPLPAVDAP